MSLSQGNPWNKKDTIYGYDKEAYIMTLMIDKEFNVRGKYMTTLAPEVRRITKEIRKTVSSAVAKAAIDSGVATNPIKNIALYKKQLARRLNPTASMLQRVSDKVSNLKKRIVFAEGEEERAIKSALIIQNSNLGNPILIGREKYINETAKKIGLDGIANLEIHNAALSEKNNIYSDFLFRKLQRKGYLYRDCQRMVNQDRNVFGSCMVAMGDADSLVSGLTRSFNDTLNHITRVISSKDNKNIIGMCMVVSRDKTVFIGDTNIIERPKPEELADIAEQMAFSVSQLGYKPRVAFASFANFGSPSLPSTSSAREAVRVLENRSVNFEFDGEMSVEICSAISMHMPLSASTT